MAASSIISHSCRISDLVAGTETSNSSAFVGEGLAKSDIRVSRLHWSSRDSERPVAALTYDEDATVCRAARGGEMCEVPSGMWMRTGSISKGTAQYSENMVATILITMSLLLAKIL